MLGKLSLDLRARITLNLGAEPYTDEARRIAIGQHQELVAAVSEGAATPPPIPRRAISGCPKI
jgi:GntR family transcriptional regulator, transcriptional repressor for pyruvate dehydrogenase complex